MSRCCGFVVDGRFVVVFAVQLSICCGLVVDLLWICCGFVVQIHNKSNKWSLSYIRPIKTLRRYRTYEYYERVHQYHLGLKGSAWRCCCQDLF